MSTDSAASKYACILAIVLLLCTAALTAGCSCDADVEPPKPLEELSQYTSGGEEQGTASNPSVELIWLIPGVPVETFELQYGRKAEALEHTIRLEAAQLEVVDLEGHGPAYRYVLDTLNWTGPLCYSMRAESSYGESKATSTACIEN